MFINCIKLGYKTTLWEGGTRVPGFIHSPLLPTSGYISDDLIHVTDWYPTLLRVAGASESFVQKLGLDGVDQYDTFFGNGGTDDDR